MSGTLAGQLTIAAQNDIIIKDNLLYHQYPNGTDVLGLIANNNVAVYHPVNSSGVNQAGSLTEPDDRRRDPRARTTRSSCRTGPRARRSATSRSTA